MFPHNLAFKNFTDRSPSDQTFSSPNCTRFSSSNSTRKRREAHNSRTQNLNQSLGMMDHKFGETSRSDRIRIKMPIDDQAQSKRMRLHHRSTDGQLMNFHSNCLISKQVEFPEKRILEKEVNEPHMIVWPPMVIVQNTLSHRDKKDKCVGIAKKKLASCFRGYKISKIKSAYGPGGHRGVSLLIFPSSAVGFLEAECLHREFLKEGRGKSQWESFGSSTQFGGDGKLYCYMATEGDMEFFNKHSKGKNKQKFDMKPYKQMIVDPLKYMEQNDQKLQQQKIEREELEKLKKLENKINCLDRRLADTIKQLTNNFDNFEREHKKKQKASHMLPNHYIESTSSVA